MNRIFLLGKEREKEKRKRGGEDGFRLSFSCLLLFSGLSYPIIIASCQSCKILIILSKNPVNPAKS